MKRAFQWKKELCNSVQLIGIVVAPVQIKPLSSGKVVASSHLAVKKSSTDTAWGPLCWKPTLLRERGWFIPGKGTEKYKRAGTKLVCAVLSLHVPSKSANPCGEQVNNLASRAVPDYTEQRTLQKLLLIGYSGSGTSAIFKQLVEAVKAQFSCDYSDHLALVWAYESWKEARRDATGYEET
ncbi:Extra-large guanine nucleotide-binding protein 1 [Camellia lanceoleosa]|uniref:Extra-large guanine nucleotide-binding protein 1 n=1 Tax=Camellia lanceoleosa TaxID=1840588 RepID=A0ACC0GFX0_9ERIC|nr:Extra-large guanine nucleotide-binding protein 1 [Camellia lanceoleosa]